MLSLQLYGPEDIRLTEEEIPRIAQDELLIRVRTAAVCGTDVRSWRYGKDFVDAAHPMTLGHEICGTVEQTGAQVSGFKKGMRVAFVPCSGCGVCDLCTHGNTHQCAQLIARGINARGLMSEYVVASAKEIAQGNIFAAPEELSDEEITLNEPLSCVYNGFLNLRVEPGDTALVIGAGPIGVMHAQLLHMAGAEVFVAEKLQHRAQLAQKIAPYITLVPADADSLTAFVTEKTQGRGVDVGITACPDPAAQQEILPLMAHNGRVHFFGGVPKELQPVALDTNLIHYKALYVTGSTCSNVWEFRKTLEFVRRGAVNLRDMVTARFDKQDAVSAFEHAKNCVGLKNIILF